MWTWCLSFTLSHGSFYLCFTWIVSLINNVHAGVTAFDRCIKVHLTIQGKGLPLLGCALVHHIVRSLSGHFPVSVFIRPFKALSWWSGWAIFKSSNQEIFLECMTFICSELHEMLAWHLTCTHQQFSIYWPPLCWGMGFHCGYFGVNHQHLKYDACCTSCVMLK